jgi:predicted DNA-binding transcriptional regulator YafY
MPVNKNALLRYRIIDSCLTNRMRKFPSMQYIIDKIEDQLGAPISESMFSKDISQMKKIYNAPIQFNRLNQGYHYTQAEFSIKEFPLTHEEIEALDYSTALLQQLKGTKIFHHFESAINKVIEGYRISAILGKSENQILQVEEPARAADNDSLEVILKAIVEKKCLKIRYQPFNRDEKIHEFSPYLLKEYRNRWYVTGYSQESKNILVLALDRITKITLSKSNFKEPGAFTSKDFFNYSLGITQVHNAVPEKIVLAFSASQAPYILSQPLHHSQKTLKTTEGKVEIELELYITPELKMAILSYGDGVKVLQPASLQKEIINIIEKMRNMYN